MAFNSFQFAVFFIAFFAAYTSISSSSARGRNAKLWLLAIGSFFFYATWNWRYVFLLVGTGIVDFYLAQAIHDSSEQGRRKALVVVSVTMNLGVLAFFKYTNFALVNVGSLLSLVGVTAPMPVLRLALPLGISFYTFQSISYTVDVYRRSFEPRRRLLEFLASLTFFPHLVAGPIVRAAQLLPQFESLPPATLQASRHGILLVAFGLAKKTMADMVGVYADRVFAGPVHSVADAWTGALAFTAQIYGDFSGYTDIAIGTALLLGFTLPKNFDLPYLATSLVDFWRRWHISLSTWLRDYLFIPLSLSNRRFPRLNGIITMTLAGLWHGPSWHFVLFGLFHGVIMETTLIVSDRVPVRWIDDDRPWGLRAFQIALTFYFIVIGQVLFRANNVPEAWIALRAMHNRATSPSFLTYSTVARLVFPWIIIVLCHALDWAAQRARLLDSGLRWWIAVVVGFAFTFVFSGTGQNFIYFQF